MNAHLVSLEKLLMRPRPVTGESWAGYLARLATENELRGIAGLGRVLGITDTALLCGTLVKGDALVVAVSDYASTALRSRGARRSWLTRICPQCVNHPKPIFQARWDRPLTLCCLEHRCMLVDRCTACDAQIRHDRRSRASCHCGQAFSSMATRPIAKWVPLMEAAYAEAIDIAVTQAAQPITELEIVAARALRFFARFEATDAPLRGRRNPYDLIAMVLSDDFETLEKLFQQNPAGLPEAFKKGFAQASGDHASLFIHERRFNAFKEIHAVLSGLRVMRPKGYVIQWALPATHRDTHVRLSLLAPMLQMSQSNLCRHGPKMLGEHVTEIPCEKTGKPLYIVEHSCVEQIQGECNALVNFDEAAAKLGIAGSSVRHLAARKTLDAPPQPYLRRFVTHDGLEKFTKQIKHLSVVSDLHRDERKTLAETVDELAQSKPTRGIDALLRDIEKGKVSLHVACANAQTLRDYFLRRSDFLRWCEGSRIAA